jgi:hypothetical protein
MILPVEMFVSLLTHGLIALQNDWSTDSLPRIRITSSYIYPSPSYFLSEDNNRKYQPNVISNFPLPILKVLIKAVKWQ